MARSLARFSLALSLAACAREPLPEICPNIEPGTLVIAELRGPQDDQDSFGHWIEIHNAGGSPVELQGLRVRFRGTSGMDPIEFLIRESVEVPAGGDAAIGPGDPDDPPQWLAYAIGWDISGGNAETDPPTFPNDLLREGSGFLELEGCDDDLLDVVYFDALPLVGTLACGNADAPPDADANDDTALPGCWCVDAADGDPDHPLFGLGQPGTPGRPNRCP